MTTWKAIVIGSSATLSTGIAAPAYASHEHYSDMLGRCEDDIASGQTSKAECEPGAYQFHLKVHTGQPGDDAFANEQNPVNGSKGKPAHRGRIAQSVHVHSK